MQRASTPTSTSESPSDSESEALLAMTPTAEGAEGAEGDTLAHRDISEDAAILADFDRYINAPATDAPSPPRAALHRLAERYPSCDKDALGAILASVGGDEHAADLILNDSQLTPVDTAADAALAQRLQRMETTPRADTARPRTRIPNTPPVYNEAAARQPDTDTDAALAASLYRMEMRRAAAMEANRHRRNEAVVPVDRGVMHQMVATLREIVVPALHAHFEELVFPDMKDSSTGLEYELQRCQVSNLSLPPDNISVKVAPDERSIRVNVVNTFLELEVGRWSYATKGFVPVKDAGMGRVSVNGMAIAITLEPRWSHAGGTKVVITECIVTIDGKVRLATQGAAADWAYKAITVVLKPLVVSYIKETIADTVSKTLAIHLSQWSFSRSLDEQNEATQTTESQRPNPAQAPVTAAE